MELRGRRRSVPPTNGRGKNDEGRHGNVRKKEGGEGERQDVVEGGGAIRPMIRNTASAEETCKKRKTHEEVLR